MLVHPLFKTLATRPELLAEHAGAYAELAGVEVAEAAARLRERSLLMAASVAFSVLGVALGGVSTLLWATIPMAQMPAPWALAAVPGVPLLTGATLWIVQRRRALDLTFSLLREQWLIDRALWREAGQAS